MVIHLIKPRSVVLGIVLAAGLAFAAAAEDAKTTETDTSDDSFTLEKAGDNFVEDAGKVGDKASEIGSDIAEGAEDAYDSAAEAVKEATE